jgi:hypothetical protein
MGLLEQKTGKMDSTGGTNVMKKGSSLEKMPRGERYCQVEGQVGTAIL